VSWTWLLPATALFAAVVVSASMLRRVAVEARDLQRSLHRWERMAVSVDDLQHESARVERNLRRLGRR
jgi:hypothetical protein